MNTQTRSGEGQTGRLQAGEGETIAAVRAETSRRWEGGEELAIRRYGEEVYF